MRRPPSRVATYAHALRTIPLVPLAFVLVMASASSAFANERSWMNDAISIRQLAPSDRIGLRVGEMPEVAAVASLVCEIHEAQPSCGSYCTSSRADRRDIPNYAAWVVDELECWDIARVLVAGAHDYDIPLDEVLATAYQESHFRRYALGSGSECGMFQQSTHRIRWSSHEVAGMARAAFRDSGEVCAYLLQPENAMWHFALKYHHERAQSGSQWAAYYNGGANMWGYLQRHESYRERFGQFVEDYQASQAEAASLERHTDG